MRAPVLFLISLAALAQPKHLIVIGVDGLGASAIEKAKTPNLHALMKRGASTLHARSVIPTVSSPNWASMIMGATPSQHGITSNEWMPNKFEISPTCQGANGTFPTIFSLLRQQRPKIKMGVVHDWKDFARLIEPNTVDYMENVKGSGPTAARAIELWKLEKPDLLFVHFDDVDHAGHNQGWWTPEYFAEVERIDGLIGDIVNAVRAAQEERNTIILVTADHGGEGKSHGGMSMAHLEIPWIIAGPSIAEGRELKQPVDTQDTAATLAHLFKVQPPACWVGRPVFEALR